MPTLVRDRRCGRLAGPALGAPWVVLAALAAHPASAQSIPAPDAAEIADTSPYEGRLVKDVRFEGLARVTDVFVRNQLRTSPGIPLSWQTVREDLRRLERLGEFRDIQASVLVDQDLNVVVLFKVVEAPIVEDVLVVGNRQLTDQDIQQTVGSVISLVKGIPIDDYQIGRAQNAIEELYRNKGYFLAQVTVDESELATEGNIIFKVREGERIKVTSIRFEGNQTFTPRQLRTAVTTREAGIFQTGAIDDTVLDGDVAALVRFYLDRGFLDARASRTITPSPDGREAIITFLIEEGRQYTLRDVSVVRAGPRDEEDAPELLTAFSPEQIRGLLEIKPGDAFSTSALERSVTAVREGYGKLGYVDARVDSLQRRVPDSPLVDLEIRIVEGERYKTGLVYVQGNDLTQQKVIRREVDIRPDRWLDSTAVEKAERRLRETRLFAQDGVKVTIQPENPLDPGKRDVLVEVEETNTGSLSFGAAVSSDSGLTGVVNLNQRNFDIGDTPDSFDEFIRGRAFRGAGQNFNISLQPGTETQTYSISLLEPYIFDTPHSLSSSLYYRTREFDDYDEERLGTRWRVARRFGTRWSGGLFIRAESVDISNIDAFAPVDLFDIQGQNTITSFGPELTRSTIDSRFRPTSGTYSEFVVEQVGALGGDFSFTKIAAEHQVYFPVWEDFMGHKTVVSLKTRAGYIPQDDEAPLFERFFLGGRSFRGFDFRGIGPLGLLRDGTVGRDHVGGDWFFFAGAEIEQPIWREIVAVVFFIDSGNVADEPGFDQYRVSIGTGLRLYIPQFGNAPLAFDFGFPLNEIDSDDTQLFSFSLDLPFQ